MSPSRLAAFPLQQAPVRQLHLGSQPNARCRTKIACPGCGGAPPCRTPSGQWTGCPRTDPGVMTPSGLDAVPVISTPHQRFTFVRLHRPYLTGSRPAFSSSRTTTFLGGNRSGRFQASTCAAASRNPPSTLVQHVSTEGCAFLCSFVVHNHGWTADWW